MFGGEILFAMQIEAMEQTAYLLEKKNPLTKYDLYADVVVAPVREGVKSNSVYRGVKYE